MELVKTLVGGSFNSLISYISEIEADINADDFYKHVDAEHYIHDIWYSPTLKSAFSAATITIILIFLFLLPYQSILYTFNLTHSAFALMIFPPLIFILVLLILNLKSIMKGKKRGITMHKYMFLFGIDLFCISILCSIITHESYWVIKLINIILILWCKFLMNSNSFSTLIKSYMRRRLSKIIMDNLLSSKKHQGMTLKH